MEPLRTHDIRAENLTLPENTRTFCVCFAGYDSEKGQDDLVYLAINTYWEDVTITLPDRHGLGAWYLSVNTYGDGNGRYFYPEDSEIRITGEFVMKPRSVAVFTGRRRYLYPTQ
ncbi:hypothetical protein IMSAGC015_01276 [Lachnospiraceae bacterium]|nr:hypothetical protein IMSAGC015_01276 [Lachnospiraceae bacterium]